jgi:hypothetical protein
MASQITYKSVAAQSAVWARVAVYQNGKRVGLIKGDSFGFRYEPNAGRVREFSSMDRCKSAIEAA